MSDSVRAMLHVSDSAQLEDRRLRELAEQAQARFDEMPPERQWLYKQAQRISYACSCLQGKDATKEIVAFGVLAGEVSEKYARWMLAKPEFRELLGLAPLPKK